MFRNGRDGVAGEMNLANLLKHMRPELQPGLYVFATVAPEMARDWIELKPLGTFREAEGLTLIVEQAEAVKAGLTCSGPMRQITLMIHSALEAVGLTAAFAAALTREGISANVIAGYYHDHIFVPEADAERAVRALETLSRGA